MSRTCTVCASPQVAAIDTAIDAGKSFRGVALRFDVSADAIARHNQHRAKEAIEQEEAKSMPVETETAPESVEATAVKHDDEERPRDLAQDFATPLTSAPITPEEVGRQEIFAYIQSRLGPQIGRIYAEANRASIAIGQFDAEWSNGLPYPRIEQYLKALMADWMGKRANGSELSARLFYLCDFGTPEQRAMLASLGLVGQ